MKDRHYTAVRAGIWYRLPWRGLRLACCDCGLTHVWTFRVRDGRLSGCVREAPRSTALKRRYKRNWSVLPKLLRIVERQVARMEQRARG